jgi:uncharacterized membrane protein
MDAPIMLMTLLPLVWPLILSGLFLLAIPDLMRRGLFFGVTVDPQFAKSPAGRGIRRRYTIAIGVATVFAIGVAVIATLAVTGAADAFAAFAALATHPRLRHIPWVLQFVVALSAFIRGNRATRPHAIRPPSVVQIELPMRPEPTGSAMTAFAIPIASLVALGAWALIHRNDLPIRLAVHWNFAGPDRWIATTPANVTKLLSLNAAVCVLFAVLAWGVLRGSRRVATTGQAAQQERRFRVRTLILLLATEYFAVFPSWHSLLSLPASAMRVWWLVWPATTLILLARLLLAGQGGSQGLAADSGAPQGDRSDDHRWAWGLIYFNRADPAFLVEKRFGIGYTFNFAHPITWAVLALIAATTVIARLL